MAKQWQLQKRVRGMRVSTVRLPSDLPHEAIRILGGPYETCIFCGRDSEVVERYRTRHDAVRGHRHWTAQAMNRSFDEMAGRH